MQEEPATLRTDDTPNASSQRKFVLRSALPGDDTIVELVGRCWTFGRDQQCDVRLTQPGVSRKHAEIERRGPVLSIRDAGSTNGTFVNGRRVEHSCLSRGQVVRLGEWLGVVEEHAFDEAGPFGYRELAPGLWGGALLSRVLRPLATAAAAGVPVVLIGRTGTGKERFARSLHWFGGAERPFHAVNCAALPGNMAEAELFGYRKGAFTGAERGYDGHLRAAHGGTLFLDEVAELPLALQAKLLRALDSGELAPLGDTAPHRFDARIVVACQVPLSTLVAAGKFREDLAARLNGLVIELPGLCTRRGDVPALFATFLQRYSGGTAPAVATRLYERLCLHDWPGNVREVELLARQLLAVHGLSPELRRSHLPPEFRDKTVEHAEAPPERTESDIDILARALQGTHGNVKKAAELAGISRQRAYRLIRSRRLGGVVAASREGERELDEDD
jgi:hypothetical protein